MLLKGTLFDVEGQLMDDYIIGDCETPRRRLFCRDNLACTLSLELGLDGSEGKAMRCVLVIMKKKDKPAPGIHDDDDHIIPVHWIGSLSMVIARTHSGSHPSINTLSLVLYKHDHDPFKHESSYEFRSREACVSCVKRI